MGLGDNLMASGMARGAKARGKRIAFGDGKTIKWDHNSATIFRGNPNVAIPGTERHTDIEWIGFYKGSRLYNTQAKDRWIWHPDKFKAQPGEIYFTEQEKEFGKSQGDGFVVIEPNVPVQKHCAPNKHWPVDRFERVADEFAAANYKVVQFGYIGSRHRLKSAVYVQTPTFRHAVALLAHAKIAILPEGGLHHGAAAVGVRAVVLFGGFIPPAVTGYDMHANLTGGVEPCGSLNRCEHCVEALKRISVEDVLKAADGLLGNG